MLFSSMLFLWIFLPVVIIGNFIIGMLPFKNVDNKISAKNIFLLIASLIFYAWGGVYYLLIMISCICINFFGGYAIAGADKKKKAALIITICANLIILFIFKYFNMVVIIIENILEPGKGSVIGMRGTGLLSLKEIVLPIGISFFTFQALSYVVDVYNGKAQLQKNILDFALYVAFFPQLIAGPIVKYSDIANQIKHRKESPELVLEGIKRFCYGIGKKVILSNTFAEVADKIWALDISSIRGLVAWLAVITYTLQIYFDFSGYSDMAIGLGRIFGFRFKENFNYPYTSLSIQEFWRRWHISLSSWFKEYVYIPLGGNRKGMGRTLLNLFIVFLLTGIWHGANFTFIAWGIYYGVFLIIERLFLGKLLEKNPVKIINYLYMIFVVMIGWIFFRSDNIYQAVDIIKGLFIFGNSGAAVLSFLSMKLLICLIIGILFSGPVQRLFSKVYEKVAENNVVMTLDFVCQMILLGISILMLVSGTYNPFIYFQF